MIEQKDSASDKKSNKKLEVQKIHSKKRSPRKNYEVFRRPKEKFH